MHFLKCINCGHLNEVKSEYLIFCTSCNKKLENNYSEWRKENPKKDLESYKQLICVSDEEIKESVAKVKSNNPKAIKYGIGVAIAFALFYAIGQFGGEYIQQIFNYEKTSEEILNQDWIRETYGSFGLTVETPNKMTKTDIPLPDNIRELIEVMDVYEYMSEKGFKVVINSLQYNVSIGLLNLQGAANGSVAEMQKQPGVTDFNYSEEEIFKDEKPGFLQTGTYKHKGIGIEFINAGFANELVYYQVMVAYQSIDDVGRIAAKRVIESIEIN